MAHELPAITDWISHRQAGRPQWDPPNLVSQCEARLDDREADVRAWVHRDVESAHAEALAVAAAQRAGRPVGLLGGVVVGIKDIIDVAGWPTEAGSPLRVGNRARFDAPVVQRLRTHGAILLGKTVTTEFACFDPPVTANPWAADRTPGGSSSGSAAAVASGMCQAALGTQTGGSITRPASFCGVCGFKPTWGRLPMERIVPVSERLDHVGPLASSVADLAAMWSALDSEFVDQASARWLSLRDGLQAPPRLGVLRGFFQARAESAVAEAVEQACQQLEAAGAVVGEDSLLADGGPRLLDAHRCLMAVDAAVYHRATFERQADQYGPAIGGLIQEGLSRPATDYAVALALQEDFRRQVAEHAWDALLLPATVTPAPDRSTTGDPSFNAPWSFAGTPTVNFPCGLSPEGLPLGLQLVGTPHRDDHLLRVALWCERHLV